MGDYEELAIGGRNPHMMGIGSPYHGVPGRNLAALASPCESDDFVAIQRQDA
jgi:hypothetical protein